MRMKKYFLFNIDQSSVCCTVNFKLSQMKEIATSFFNVFNQPEDFKKQNFKYNLSLDNHQIVI